MERKTCVELSRGEVDWVPVRECFVRAFYRYPLYKYLIPNESIREEFLRLYLEANYDVAVRRGNSILLAINLYHEQNPEEVSDFQKTIVAPTSLDRTVVGGVLFVPPAREGGGWECADDKLYWDAYERYRLKDVDNESLLRVIRYEKWETENVANKVCAQGIPLWNGLFCAIDPAHAGSGCGSMNYADCMKIMAQIHTKNQLKLRNLNSTPSKVDKTPEKKTPEEKRLVGDTIFARKQADNWDLNNNSPKCGVAIFRRLLQFFGYDKNELTQPSGETTEIASNKYKMKSGCGVSLLHSLALLHHRPRVLPNPTMNIREKKTCHDKEATSARQTETEKTKPKSELPMVIALSHSQRAASFHKKNGFQLAGEVPFNTHKPVTDGESTAQGPFNVHLLLMDPFHTGKTDEIARAFKCSNTADSDHKMPLYKQETDDVADLPAARNPKPAIVEDILKSSLHHIASPTAS